MLRGVTTVLGKLPPPPGSEPRTPHADKLLQALGMRQGATMASVGGGGGGVGGVGGVVVVVVVVGGGVLFVLFVLAVLSVLSVVCCFSIVVWLFVLCWLMLLFYWRGSPNACSDVVLPSQLRRRLVTRQGAVPSSAPLYDEKIRQFR